MNNKIVILILFVVVIIAAGLFYFTQNQYQSDSQTISQTPQNAVRTNTVTIQNFAFNPSALTIKKGEKIIWINQESLPHNIRSDTFSSPNLNSGDQFEFTFNNAGNYDYYCGIHPSMTGKIAVE